MKDHLTKDQINNLKLAKSRMAQDEPYIEEKKSYFLGGLFGSDDPCGEEPPEGTEEHDQWAKCKQDRAKETSETVQKSLDFGLNVVDFLKDPSIEGEAGGVQYDTGKQPKSKKILGMPAAVFWIMLVIVIAVIIYIIYKARK